MALSALPIDCPRAIPPKFPKPIPVTGAKKGEKFASPAQVANFDILGARLYMPVRDVLASVQALGIFKDDPEVVPGPCVSDQIEFDRLSREDAKHLSLWPRNSCVRGLTFRSKDGPNAVTLTVYFVEDLPQHPGCMVSDSISLDETGERNPASMLAWDQALTAKYGPPLPFYRNEWGVDHGPMMQDLGGLYDLELVLRDDGFTEDRANARWKVIEDARPTVQPKL